MFCFRYQTLCDATGECELTVYRNEIGSRYGAAKLLNLHDHPRVLNPLVSSFVFAYDLSLLRWMRRFHLGRRPAGNAFGRPVL